jgi:hypothetical protein
MNAQLKTVDASNNEAKPSSKRVVSTFVPLDGRINTVTVIMFLKASHSAV